MDHAEFDVRADAVAMSSVVQGKDGVCADSKLFTKGQADRLVKLGVKLNTGDIIADHAFKPSLQTVDAKFTWLDLKYSGEPSQNKINKVLTFLKS